MKKMSNQQKWRLKHIAKGNCPNCGKPNETDFFNCQACHDKQVDVIDAFSTDGRIAKFDLKILEDDKRFFPPYDAAFVVRGEALRRHPQIHEALELLAGRIANADMQRMNYAVDEEGRTERDVAREFLVSKGLLPVGSEQDQ